jgi:hypothetical protein
LLYGANTAGAVAGTLIAGFHLIGQVGVWRSFLFAAAVNAVTAVTAFVADRRAVSLVHSDAEHPAASPTPAADQTPAARRSILTAFIISGAASLALEVIWFRILVVHLGATIYAFVSMLATFLSGIAIGSWAIVPLARRASSLPVLAGIQAATGLVTAAIARARREAVRRTRARFEPHHNARHRPCYPADGSGLSDRTAALGR